MSKYYVVEIEVSEPNFGHLVGPFEVKEWAHSWASENIRNGCWNIAPLNNGEVQS